MAFSCKWLRIMVTGNDSLQKEYKMDSLFPSFLSWRKLERKDGDHYILQYRKGTVGVANGNNGPSSSQLPEFILYGASLAKSRCSCLLILEFTTWLALANGPLACTMHLLHSVTGFAGSLVPAPQPRKEPPPGSCCHSARVLEQTCIWRRYPPPAEKPSPARSRAWSKVTWPKRTPAFHTPTPTLQSPAPTWRPASDNDGPWKPGDHTLWPADQMRLPPKSPPSQLVIN